MTNEYEWNREDDMYSNKIYESMFIETQSTQSLNSSIKDAVRSISE